MVNQILVSAISRRPLRQTLCRKAARSAGGLRRDLHRMGSSAIFASRVRRSLTVRTTVGAPAHRPQDLGIVEDTARDLGIPMLMTAQATQLSAPQPRRGGSTRDCGRRGSWSSWRALGGHRTAEAVTVRAAGEGLLGPTAAGGSTQRVKTREKGEDPCDITRGKRLPCPGVPGATGGCRQPPLRRLLRSDNLREQKF